MTSVRIISPDWQAVRSSLTAWAEDLVSTIPGVLGVLLFGSLARNEHAPGSDADLIVIVRRSSVPPDERPEGLPTLRSGLPADITVYTVEELKRFLGEGFPFLLRALREGRWLATAPGWEPPVLGEESGS